LDCGCKGCPAKTLWALFTILLLGGIALLAGGLVRTVPCTTDLVNCEKGLAKGSQQHTVCWDTFWTCTSGVAREVFFGLSCGVARDYAWCTSQGLLATTGWPRSLERASVTRRRTRRAHRCTGPVARRSKGRRRARAFGPRWREEKNRLNPPPSPFSLPTWPKRI
jgi:hypothetical protein